MTTPRNTSRRLFLKHAAALSTLGTSAAPMALNLAAMSEAAAQTATDYKALVCIFLHGGNDAFNTVLATDTDSWTNYTATRNQAPTPIALLSAGTAADKTKTVGSPAWLGGVLPLNPLTTQTGRSFALHPLLTGAQDLFNTQRKLAIVANVGPLIEPITKQEYLGATKLFPKKLYSHNDQQNTWLGFQPEGSTRGWGGLMGDYFAASNGGSLFTAISAAGNTVWLAGDKVAQYQLSPNNGAVKLGANVYNPTISAALEKIASQARTPDGMPRHVMAQDLANTARRSIAAESVLSSALPASTASPYGPDSRLQYTNLNGVATENSLARQLQVVARTIAIRQTLGIKRQVFFVNLTGFDTHDDQNTRHAELMAKLDQALVYFDNTLTALGVANQVTTFTASDFGRTFTSNGDGTDHGWGGHHFVMGGAVSGGKIYGSFPTLARKNTSNNFFDGSAQQIQNGILLPNIAVDQYAATLGKWFGLTDTQLREVMPNLYRFSSNPTQSMV